MQPSLSQCIKQQRKHTQKKHFIQTIHVIIRKAGLINRKMAKAQN